MKMRDVIKMNGPNDGTRSLYESVLPNEVLAALRDWGSQVTEPVLIGGVALSFYVRPRFTDDLDYLFLSEEAVPETVAGFKKVRDHSFLHNKTHVEVEVLTPEFLGIDPAIVRMVHDTATVSDGVKVASPEGLIVLKVQRNMMQDKADIVALLKTAKVDLRPWHDVLSRKQRETIRELGLIATKEKGE